MARGNHLNGLDMMTRRKTSTRAFEDMKAGKDQTVKINNPSISEKRTERVTVGSREKQEHQEVPYFKPRLTVRARKVRPIKTGVSISEE